jgi:hypothetical protein
MTKNKEVYTVSGTPEVKGKENEMILWMKLNGSVFLNNSSVGVLNTPSSCLFGIFWFLSLLCSTKRTCVWIYDYNKKRSFGFLLFCSSVGIVCMVNSDVDNDDLTSSHSSDSPVINRNIPESCHKHTVEKNQSVRLFSC